MGTKPNLDTMIQSADQHGALLTLPIREGMGGFGDCKSHTRGSGMRLPGLQGAALGNESPITYQLDTVNCINDPLEVLGM